jgi:hypothetical protein
MAAREALSWRRPRPFLYIYMYGGTVGTTPPNSTLSISASLTTRAHRSSSSPPSISLESDDRNYGPAEQQDARGGGVPRRPGAAGGGAGGVRVRLLRRLLRAVRQRQAGPRLHEDVHRGMRRRRQGQCRRRRSQQALSFVRFNLAQSHG